jgi:hypothetical protein
LPEDWAIKECKIHMNYLMLRQTGCINKEVGVLAESGASNGAVRVLDFRHEEFQYEKTLQLEMQTCSIKFGHFARETLKVALAEGRVAAVEFDERTH